MASGFLPAFSAGFTGAVFFAALPAFFSFADTGFGAVFFAALPVFFGFADTGFGAGFFTALPAGFAFTAVFFFFALTAI
ncbi:MAG TPA: hypothetical protein PLT67_10190 [Kiritimatiellia bacterium]|nr:hypothetical protein [Kiritimatiellia bacterium]HPA78988.1 hypothetical protein [Kiritimatiellia bacterium]HQQ05190.1 hypothetical protein [Kiritimatiellia bacterium]